MLTLNLNSLFSRIDSRIIDYPISLYKSNWILVYFFFPTVFMVSYSYSAYKLFIDLVLILFVGFCFILSYIVLHDFGERIYSSLIFLFYELAGVLPYFIFGFFLLNKSLFRVKIRLDESFFHPIQGVVTHPLDWDFVFGGAVYIFYLLVFMVMFVRVFYAQFIGAPWVPGLNPFLVFVYAAAMLCWCLYQIVFVFDFCLAEAIGYYIIKDPTAPIDPVLIEDKNLQAANCAESTELSKKEIQDAKNRFVAYRLFLYLPLVICFVCDMI